MFKVTLLVSFILLSSLNASYVFSCLCSASLSPAYEKIDNHINTENLKEIDANIDDVLKSLDDNITSLDKDILVLKELNKTLKLEIVQLSEYGAFLYKYKDTLDKKLTKPTTINSISK